MKSAIEIGDGAREGAAYESLGNTYYFQGDYRKSIKCHEKQLKIAIQVGDRARERRAYRNLGKASTHWVNLKRPLSIKKKI